MPLNARLQGVGIVTFRGVYRSGNKVDLGLSAQEAGETKRDALVAVYFSVWQLLMLGAGSALEPQKQAKRLVK